MLKFQYYDSPPLSRQSASVFQKEEPVVVEFDDEGAAEAVLVFEALASSTFANA